ncbi:hypothetical protein E2I00_015159, partial [Balaenoptera physalus]
TETLLGIGTEIPTTKKGLSLTKAFPENNNTTIILLHISERKEILSLDKLEGQLKACNFLLVFAKAKPSVLTLCLLNLELVIKYSKIDDTESFYWRSWFGLSIGTDPTPSKTATVVFLSCQQYQKIVVLMK